MPRQTEKRANKNRTKPCGEGIADVGCEFGALRLRGRIEGLVLVRVGLRVGVV